MNLIRQTRLRFTEGKSDKVYEVDLLATGSHSHDADQATGYIVNFRYGRYGSNLREGTKTAEPVSLAKATQLFDSLVVSKRNKGYQEVTAAHSSSMPDVGSYFQKNTVAATASPTVGELTDPRLLALQDIIVSGYQDRSLEALHRVDRAVWRLGELQLTPDEFVALTPTLMQLVGTSLWMRNYCLAWYFGRHHHLAKYAEQRGFIENILQALLTLQDAPELPVQRFAKASYLLVLNSSSQDHQSAVNDVVQKLPTAVGDTIQTWLDSHDEQSDSPLQAQQVQACVDVLCGVGAGTVNNNVAMVHANALSDVFIWAQFDARIHTLLLQVLSQLPVRTNVFRAIRHCFKLAELFSDEAAWGLLSMRLTTTSGKFSMDSYRSFRGDGYGDGYVACADEVKKPDSRLAYSHNTHDYFQRRVWRRLRRMAEVHYSEAYVAAATEYLLAFDDAKAPAASRRDSYEWRNENNRWHRAVVSSTHYPLFAKAMPLYHILLKRNSRVHTNATKTTWLYYSNSTELADNGAVPATAARTESWSELWDQHPDYLLRLVREAKAQIVHSFAAKALRENPVFCEQQTTDIWVELLGSSYAETSQLAYEVLAERYRIKMPEQAVLLAFFDCDIEAAQEQACQWVERQTHLLSDGHFAIKLLTHRRGTVRMWARELLVANRIRLAADWWTQLLDYLMALPVTTPVLTPVPTNDSPEIPEVDQAIVAAVAQDVGWLLVTLYAERFNMTQIGLLLSHPLEQNQATAARLLIKQGVSPERIEPAVLVKLIDSPSAEVRSLGVQLFGQLSTVTLAQQSDLLAGFCLADDPEVRQAARPVVIKLCRPPARPPEELLHKLIGGVFRSESSAGLHDDLLSLLQTIILDYQVDIDNRVIWRLLQAKSYAAQDLGASLLQERFEPQQFSVKQWVGLANHEQAAMRQWACQAFVDHPQRSRETAMQTLRLLESDWPDTRQFAKDFIQQHFTDDNWSPELLISICDSNRDDIQQYGRQLITRFFSSGDGAEYLLKLSQHPANTVQLFATQYLQDYASGQPDYIVELELYFVTVLSQVNRARIAKARIQRFLLQEAKQDREVAELVARIFARQSVTEAMVDKAAYLEGMRDLQALYPHISQPIQTVPMRTWSKHTSNDHAANSLEGIGGQHAI